MYEIISILRTEPPPGTDGSDWYHYKIAHGRDIINGYKQGSLGTVTTAVENNVDQLNERQIGNPTRTNVVKKPKFKPCN